MFEEAVNQLKKDLLGFNPNPEFVQGILNGTYEKESSVDNLPKANGSKSELIPVVLTLITFMYHEHFDEVESYVHIFAMNKSEISEIAGLAFGLAIAQKKFEKCSTLLYHYEIGLDMTYRFIRGYVDFLLNNKKYSKAYEVWSYYKEKYNLTIGFIEQSIKEIFNKSMTLIRNKGSKDYSDVFEFVREFHVPHKIIYSKAMSHFNYNMSHNNQYQGALIAKNLELGSSLTKNAAFQALKAEVKKFNTLLKKGAYNIKMKILDNDPFIVLKNIIKEFDIYNVNKLHQTDLKEKSLYLNVFELVSSTVTKILDGASFTNLDENTRYYLAISLINDFRLYDDALSVAKSNDIIVSLNMMLRNINSKITDLKSALQYEEILKFFKGISLPDVSEINSIGRKLFILSLKEKDINRAKYYYDLFSLKLHFLTIETTEIVFNLVDKNDFDTLINLLKAFPIKDEFTRDKRFMDTMYNLYFKSVIECKEKKSNEIAAIFGFGKDIKYKAIKELVFNKIEEIDFEEAKKLISKHKIKKKDLQGRLKDLYRKLIKEDKQTACQLRKEFGITIMDIGILTWLLREVIGIGKH